ncbi:SdpI family protein [Leifsonia sp. NPDC058194]|uniref:SdpI family protein n=1 Tax=Leifsonia sp. NPDC058194 TaxID=3346374 RepID=UPI0036D902C4
MATLVLAVGADIVIELAAHGRLRRNSVVGIRTQRVRQTNATWVRGHAAAVWPARATAMLVTAIGVWAVAVESPQLSVVLTAAGVVALFLGTGTAALVASRSVRRVRR